MIHRAAMRAGVLACLAFPCVSVSVSAATVQAGDLILSEFMANPTGLSDAQGEWLELFNTTLSDLDLRGLSLSDDGSNSHTIASPTPVIIPGGGYALLGRSGDIDGGGRIAVDYIYSGFILNNSVDQIVLSQGTQEVLRLNYTASMVTPGRSTELRALTSSGPSYAFTPVALSYDGGSNMGTPGTTNSQAFSAAPVPLPPALSLFLAALAAMFGSRFMVRYPPLSPVEPAPAG